VGCGQENDVALLAADVHEGLARTGVHAEMVHELWVHQRDLMDPVRGRVGHNTLHDGRLAVEHIRDHLDAIL